MTTSYIREAQKELKKMKKLRNEAENALRNKAEEPPAEAAKEPKATEAVKPKLKAKAKKKTINVESIKEDKGENNAS